MAHMSNVGTGRDLERVCYCRARMRAGWPDRPLNCATQVDRCEPSTATNDKLWWFRDVSRRPSISRCSRLDTDQVRAPGEARHLLLAVDRRGPAVAETRAAGPSYCCANQLPSGTYWVLAASGQVAQSAYWHSESEPASEPAEPLIQTLTPLVTLRFS